MRQRDRRIDIGLTLQAIAVAVLGAIAWVVLVFLYGVVVGLIKHGLSSMLFVIWLSAHELTSMGKNLSLAGGLVGAVITSLRFLWKQSIRRTVLIAIYSPLCAVLAVSVSWAWYQNHLDTSAIKHRFSRFCSAIYKSQYDTAYSCMSPEYQRTHLLDEFKIDKNLEYGLYYNIEAWGCDLSPGHRVEISGNNAVLYALNYSFMELYGGPTYELVKVKEVWWFTGESTWYTD